MTSGPLAQATATDTTEQYVILNEQAVQRLGLGTPAGAVGQSVVLYDSVPVQVVGVVKDFRYQSMGNSFPSSNVLVLSYRPDWFQHVSVRVAPGTNLLATNQQLQALWKRLYPGQAYEAHFYEDYFREAHGHRDDLQMIYYIVVVSLTIAFLGLLAIASYLAESKIKEIGIRKVLGAEARQLLWLLSKKLLLLLALAVALGLPLGYLLGQAILAGYAVKVGFALDLLPLSVLIMAALGLPIVLSQAWRAARANPVDSLRSE
jgi:putative ABC transport system permease protein